MVVVGRRRPSPFPLVFVRGRARLAAAARCARAARARADRVGAAARLRPRRARGRDGRHERARARRRSSRCSVRSGASLRGVAARSRRSAAPSRSSPSAFRTRCSGRSPPRPIGARRRTPRSSRSGGRPGCGRLGVREDVAVACAAVRGRLKELVRRFGRSGVGKNVDPRVGAARPGDDAVPRTSSSWPRRRARVRGSRVHVLVEPAEPRGRLAADRRGRAAVPARARRAVRPVRRDRPLQGRQHDDVRDRAAARASSCGRTTCTSRCGPTCPATSSTPSCRDALDRYGLDAQGAPARRRLPQGRAAVAARSSCCSSTATIRYEGARADFERWSALVRPGGHLLFHDAVDSGGYGNVYPGVARFVGEIDAAAGSGSPAPARSRTSSGAREALIAVVLNWNGGDGHARGARLARRRSRRSASTTARPTAPTTSSSSGSPTSSCSAPDANLGFAGGNNVGIRRALERGADWVLLLNNDAVAEPALAAALERAAAERPDAGLLACKILARTATVQYAGASFNAAARLLRPRRGGSPDVPPGRAARRRSRRRRGARGLARRGRARPGCSTSRSSSTSRTSSGRCASARPGFAVVYVSGRRRPSQGLARRAAGAARRRTSTTTRATRSSCSSGTRRCRAASRRCGAASSSARTSRRRSAHPARRDALRAVLDGWRDARAGRLGQRSSP